MKHFTITINCSMSRGRAKNSVIVSPDVDWSHPDVETYKGLIVGALRDALAAVDGYKPHEETSLGERLPIQGDKD